jgi:hypothetical protein
MLARRPTLLAVVAITALAGGVPSGAAAAAREHEVALGFGPTSNGGCLLFSWTSPARVGVYARMFPTLQDDQEPSPNSTVTDETAGEFGIAVRITPWLTLGAGFGRYEKVVTSYGDPDWLFGVPSYLGEEATEDTGAAALAIFTLTPRDKAAALSLAVSLSPAGSGAAIGVMF